MSEKISIRAVRPEDVAADIDALADGLIDGVEGGASVSFLLPISRETAVQFWRDVAHSVMRNERILMVAEDADGQVVGTVQLITVSADVKMTPAPK